MQTHFHRLLQSQIEEEIRARGLSVTSGACTDYPHYQYHIGFIAGLQAALAVAGEIEQERD
jgi:hypothetical protein